MLHRALSIVLLQGPRGALFLMGEVSLCGGHVGVRFAINALHLFLKGERLRHDG